MNNLLVLPLLIPAITAVILIFLKERVRLQRIISAVSVFLNIFVAGFIVYQVNTNGIQTLYMGGWRPPYGIVFVADMFSALLVLTAAIVGAACLFFSFASIGEDRERFYYYPFFHFLLTGVFGSFLTGDLFNLFVCFEVLLVASYALIVLGGSKGQLRETLKYVLINVISSSLFVATIAYLYAATGTLNMAHLSMRVAEAGQGGVMNVIAVLLLIVFSIKAGLLLFFWLPDSYSAPPLAVRALFGALLTKVGLYAITRTFTLIFIQEPGLTHTLIAWMAGATMILGAIGALAYNDLGRIFNYNIIISVGFIAFGISVATQDSLNGVVFYLMHDMVAKALLFFLGGMIISASGTDRLKEMGGLIRRYPWTGWMFFVLTLALVGVPPLSGFAGKVMMVRSGFGENHVALALIALASSFVVLYSLIKVFQQVFWGGEKREEQVKPLHYKAMMAPAAVLFAIVILMGVGAETVNGLVSQAGAVLADPALYINAVMKE
ncbi:Na+/H+ antiporter subunit D [Paenibacillus odorifer]|jgi:multicomponent Na+:H+ antiporter subunit D|uniref:Na+/H+ antiporter subunit D n=1 Tax=Paenibacillus odorifer TaxID=189426 RepID=A0ABX3H0S5_9BACL|nr:Na+/H+ antiporter subunit D [Paenibacillus odorifer]OMC73837.1 Na+/H+ antiporter subunit D [Paenibacillus odorifer]OMD39690.1 Na+/H+ antiporter subunit D [Paenibacillus odorifer]OMD61010.1 Na+/H+ antiporter subunit D [Paenibacillus odorifer]OMD67072.1 Na+/H+ antiporter subunit D [Paenibacillus odorifer]OMD95121.1 Na+/H+ antiporter subunit D [Paenibacillus odorifer]